MTTSRIKHYYPPGPIAAAFHKSTAFIRAIMGPVGSGKSTTCVAEALRLSAIQPPQYDGVRRSRGVVIRNTYPDLEQTTVPTWLMWSPEEHNKMNWGSPLIQHVQTKDLDMEVIFLALDRDEDVRKLMSMEVTWAWVNESRYIPKAVVDALTGRVGRWPPVSEGGCTQPSILCDTNPPDSEHWHYKLAEHADEDMERSIEVARLELVKMGALWPDQPLFEFFRQPGGLSSDAENILNLRKGYYHFISAGKSEDWTKVYVDGEYGFVVEGRPVYPMYRDSTHTAKQKLQPIPGNPLMLGVDLGLTPACVIGQKLADGRWRILDEFCAVDCGLVRFAESLGSYLETTYPGYDIGGGWLDPAGRGRDTEERTAQDIFKAHIKCPWHYAQTNDFQPRREVIVSVLNRMVDGQPGIEISPDCKLLREGAISKYHFKQMRSANGADFHEIPVKNGHSHPHEALQYLIMGGGEYQVVMNKTERVGRSRVAEGVGEDAFPEPKRASHYTSKRDMRAWMDRKPVRPQVARDTDDTV